MALAQPSVGVTTPSSDLVALCWLYDPPLLDFIAHDGEAVKHQVGSQLPDQEAGGQVAADVHGRVHEQRPDQDAVDRLCSAKLDCQVPQGLGGSQLEAA